MLGKCPTTRPSRPIRYLWKFQPGATPAVRASVANTGLAPAPATRLFANQVVPWLERDLVRPVVDSVFPFQAVRDGHGRLESNQVFGKVILRI